MFPEVSPLGVSCHSGFQTDMYVVIGCCLANVLDFAVIERKRECKASLTRSSIARNRLSSCSVAPRRLTAVPVLPTSWGRGPNAEAVVTEQGVKHASCMREMTSRVTFSREAEVGQRSRVQWTGGRVLSHTPSTRAMCQERGGNRANSGLVLSAFSLDRS